MQVRLSGEAKGGTSSWPSDIQSGNTVTENGGIRLEVSTIAN